MRDDAWKHVFREWRHNPCLMRPVSAIVLSVMLLVWLITLILKVPTLLLTLVLAKVLNRFPFVIEFLYPTALGKWIHLTLVDKIMKSRQHHHGIRPGDKNRGFHSRCLEQRIEIVAGRVYLHPLPQYLDNLGYLVVCCPPSPKTRTSTYTSTLEDKKDSTSPNGSIVTTITTEQDATSELVAFLVDCGQALSVMQQIELIRQYHYQNRPIIIQSILSTHKHHDHTGGNLTMLQDPHFGAHLKFVVGGAVEQVPGCNCPVSHGDLVPLPRHGNNNMNDLIDVEVICTPAHTRGSVTYALRPLRRHETSQDDGLAYLFTGDTVFCGGSGVPFEADIASGDNTEANLTPTSVLRATAGNLAVERCFAEILAQCYKGDLSQSSSPTTPIIASDRIVILPGHEYTMELLSRQITQTIEACRWKNFAPRFFFETVSHLLVASHRRSLPHSSGKLVSAMTTLRRELIVNPQLRMLRKRGEQVLRAIQHWHRHFAQVKISYPVDENANGDVPSSESAASKPLERTPNTLSLSARQWNLQASDLDRPVFCTVYAADLESIITDLQNGRMDGVTAARHLSQMQQVLDLPTIGRRPVPDTLPSDRNIVRALVGFCLLGSTPSALTLSDSLILKLPPPVVGNSSDRISISKSRLLRVLHMLGLTHGTRHARVSAMLDQLWKEAKEYSDTLASFDPSSSGKSLQTVTYESVDVEVEVRTATDDLVDLGALRWVVFGVPRPAPFLSRMRYCLPCKLPIPASEQAEAKLNQSHPIHTCGLTQHSGELVRHDLTTCLLCVSMTGCQSTRPDEGGEGIGTWDDALLQCTSSTVTPLATTSRILSRAQSSTSIDEGMSTEVTPQVLNELLREA